MEHTAVSYDDQQLNLVLKALADATRRRILEIVAQQPGLTIQELVACFPVSRFAIMKHLNVLESATLVRRERDGGAKHLYLNPAPLDHIPAWLTQFPQQRNP